MPKTDQSDQAQIAVQTKLQIDEQAILDEINRAKDISPAADAALASCAQKVGWNAFSPSPNQSVGQLVKSIPGTVSFLDYLGFFLQHLHVFSPKLAGSGARTGDRHSHQGETNERQFFC